MSQQISGIALQFGSPPAVRPVTHVQQAAEIATQARTLIVIGPTKRQRNVRTRLAQKGEILKEACLQLLNEQVGKSSKRSFVIQRFHDSSAFLGEYGSYAEQATARNPVKPKLMLIEPMLIETGDARTMFVSDQKVSFEKQLREALDLLEQLAGPDMSAQRPPPGSDDDRQLQLARERRDQLLADEKWFNAPEVHVQQGHDPNAQGVNNTASRLRRDKLLLGAWNGREYLHPQFQFDRHTGRLMPEVEPLLEVLPKDRSGWRQVFWLFQKHARLQNRRPADIFQDQPTAVIEAARSDFVIDDERW
ncbi:hypothetical protein JM946_20020 [Steroidobacter sp. S1-65]|uniref:Uncharacterized protein n=1 Tax=Steroidobacter gossypii TaxID=2805490 RepID=A0ABS1X1E6_9GAMM|nr:hypothetical protein [Steroidobacter gossypii]MBM0107031.1 hypothetical protein [Steroidobacter gossypii]